MLTRSGSFRHGLHTVFLDRVFRDGRPAFGPRVYAVPDAPRLGRDAAGVPAFDFVWYRRPPGETGPGGAASGMVVLAADLGPEPGELAGLAAAAGERLGLPAADVEVLPVPFSGGTVELSFAGETGDLDGAAGDGDPAGGGDLARRIAGSGPARFAGHQRASFACELTEDGAALLRQALERGVEVFHLRYDLTFEHRLDDLELRVWCDAERAHAVVAERLAAGPLAAGELAELVTSRRIAGIELVESGEPSAERREELAELGRGVLERALASALFTGPTGDADAGGGGDGGALDLTRLRPFSRSISARLNHRFSQSMPVTGRLAVAGPLPAGPDLLARTHRHDLTHGFFDVLDVAVHAAVDFEGSPVDTVKVTLRYDETAPGGERVVRAGELVFRRGETQGRFRCDLAAPELRRFRYEVEVRYDGAAEPWRFSGGPIEATALVLDLGAAGVLAVDVELRDVPFDRVRGAVVDLEHPATGLTERLILDGEHASGRWRAVVRERSGPYRWRAAWLTADGRRVEGDWRESSARTLALDAPPELTATREVMVVAAGDFAGLAQIVVDLETVPVNAAEDEPENEPDRAQLAFTAPGESRTWSPRVAGADLRYRARQTLVLAAGGRVELDWEETDRLVLVVRDPLRREVQVIARLLDLGGAWRLALLALEAGGGGARGSLVLTSPDDRPSWSYRRGRAGDDAYRFRLTLVAPGGERLETPWQDGRGEVLVLRPPSET